MSEAAKVKLLGEDKARLANWNRLLPFEKNGRKLTLKKKQFVVYVSVASALVLFLQILLDTKDSHLPGGSSISAPDAVANARTFDVPTSRVATSRDQLHGGESWSGRKPRRTKSRYQGAQVISRPVDLGHIPPGSYFEARLTSGGSNGLVRAEVTKGLTVSGDLLIPQGAVLVGNGTSTEERLFIRFGQVVFRDGTFGTLAAEACDKSDKIRGLKGSKLGNKALNIAGSIGLGFVGGLSEGLQETEGQQGAVIRKPTLGNALLNVTGTTALEQSQNLMSDLKDRKPIIEVPAGTEICILTSGGSQ